jgi:hypothetical protein
LAAGILSGVLGQSASLPFFALISEPIPARRASIGVEFVTGSGKRQKSLALRQ